MKTKHTPGPWKSKEENSLTIKTTEIFTNSVDVTNISEPIMRIRHNEEKLSESIANAKLIAAAPDLLQALIKLSDAFLYEAMEKHDKTYTPNEFPAYETSLRAIKKATE